MRLAIVLEFVVESVVARVCDVSFLSLEEVFCLVEVFDYEVIYLAYFLEFVGSHSVFCDVWYSALCLVGGAEEAEKVEMEHCSHCQHLAFVEIEEWQSGGIMTFKVFQHIVGVAY